MQRISCPHCGYRNQGEQHFCSRCEQSLHETPETAEAADDELKTQVDLRLGDFSFGEPAPRATGPTDLHAHLLPQGPSAPGGELPLPERPTAPWPEGDAAPQPLGEGHEPEASKTTLEPWAQATALMSSAQMAPERSPDNWRSRGTQPAPPPLQPRIVQRDSRAAQPRVIVPQPKLHPPGTRRLDGRERLREVARAEAAPIIAPQPAVLHSADAEAPWPTPLRQLVALSIDVTVMVGASMGLLSLLIAALPRAAWPAGRPTLMEASAMWLAHSGRAPLLLVVGSMAVAVLYTLWGATNGQTLGRMLCGLRLVDARGQSPGLGAGLWHILGGAVGLGALGAGLLWPIVDPAARTWASLTSRTFVIRT